MKTALRTLTLALAASLMWGLAPLAAQNPKETTSLKFAPADASFYSVSLRRKEMLERVTASKAYQKMVEHRVLSTAIAQGTASYEAALNQFKQENPEAWAVVRGFYEQGLTLLADMFSHECFWYGGPGWIDAAPRLQAISNRINAMATEFGQLSEEERIEKLMAVLDDSEVQQLLGGLRTPELVMGFKVTNRQLADDQLTVLTFGLRQAISSDPDLAPLRSIYKKETLSGGPFHVFTLDMSLFTPELLEKIKQSDGEQAVAVITKLKSTLKDLAKVVIGLGRIEDYLIVSIANDQERLANWGKGRLLYDVAELAPLRKASDRKFTDINYVSKELAAAAANPAAIEGQMAQLRQLRDQFTQAGLGGEIPLTEESIKKLADLYLEDMEKLQKLAQEEIDPRAELSFTYDVASGFETMQYSFGEEKSADGGKPLSILRYVGANPILFAAGRAKVDDDAGEVLDYLVKRMVTLFDAIEFGDDEEGKEMQEFFDKLVEKAKPIAEEFSQITREKILPALQDGQTALVIDASLTTDRLDPSLPPAEDDLRLPEIAIVVGVSDADQLRDGLKAYLALGRKVIAQMRELEPESIPEGVTIPDPELTSEEGGDLATYAIPDANDTVSRFVMPTLGLGKDVAILALHRTTAARLLKGSELEQAAGELKDSLDKPLAGASQFDFHQLMNVVESYLSYAVDVGAYDGLAAQSPFSAEELQEQTALVLDFLRCYQRTTSVTYVEEGATVTRSVSVYVDYEAASK